jgi:quinohemoprotein ethanol dehydrogenase
MLRRRSLFFVIAVVAAAGTLAAAGSASNSAPRKTARAQAFLPAGVVSSGANWAITGGDLAGSGYSTLNQINTKNVSKLKMIWEKSYNNAGQGFNKPQNQPIVVSASGLPMNPTMFLEYNQGVLALNPTTGAILWKYQGIKEKGGPLAGTGSQNGIGRAISYGNGMIFAGQQDGSVVALNAKNGSPVWTVDTTGAGTTGQGNVFGETNPPTTYYNEGGNGLVFAAPNGGDQPLRGHFDAYDAKSGKLVWRTWTTPDPTQLPFILSWGNPAQSATGGAAVWSLPTIDPQTHTVYFGTGNAFPYNNRAPGKNLWTESLMALNTQTGGLKWYFQTTHHDEWDYDDPNPPVRVNVNINGKTVPVVAMGSKNGWLYVLNAKNGSYVPNYAIPEVKVQDLNDGKGAALNSTWPTQPEPSGGAGEILPHCLTASDAAAIIPGFPNAPNGTKIVPTCTYAHPYSDAYYTWYPAYSGGINWNRMSYNPKTNDLYICASISVMGFENISPTNPNQSFIGTFLGGDGGTISALNMSTNKLDWQVKIPRNYDTPGGPTVRNGTCYSGTLATAGGLVFAAQNVDGFTEGSPPVPGIFYAYDAKSGKQLWSFTNPQGSTIHAAPVTYMVNGKQYIAIMMHSLLNPQGSHNFTPGSATSPPVDHLTVFALS